MRQAATRWSAAGKESNSRNCINILFPYVFFVCLFVSDWSPWASCRLSPSAFSCFPKVRLKSLCCISGFCVRCFPFPTGVLHSRNKRWIRAFPAGLWINLWNTVSCRRGENNARRTGYLRNQAGVTDPYARCLTETGKADAVMILEVHKFLQCNYLVSPELINVIFGV